MTGKDHPTTVRSPWHDAVSESIAQSPYGRKKNSQVAKYKLFSSSHRFWPGKLVPPAKEIPPAS
jgi:hypothetical protein